MWWTKAAKIFYFFSEKLPTQETCQYFDLLISIVLFKQQYNFFGEGLS